MDKYLQKIFKLFIIAVLIQNNTGYAFKIYFLAPPGIHGGFKMEFIERDLVKLDNTHRDVLFKDLIQKEPYKTAYDELSADSSWTFVEDYLSEGTKVGQLLCDTKIPLYIRTKIHDVVIDPYIEMYYNGYDEDNWHVFGTFENEQSVIQKIEEFFVNILEFPEAAKLMHDLIDAKMLNQLHDFNEEAICLFMAHSSKKHGINISSKMSHNAPAIVHELLELSGFHDHIFNATIDTMYNWWTLSRSISGNQSKLINTIRGFFKKNIINFEVAYDNFTRAVEHLEICDIYDSRVFKVQGAGINKFSSADEKPVFKDIKDMNDSLSSQNMIKRKIPILFNTLQYYSKTSEISKKAWEHIEEIIKYCNDIPLDIVYVEFQTRGLEIEGNFRALFEQEYLQRWTSELMYQNIMKFQFNKRVHCELQRKLIEIAIFANRGQIFDCSPSTQLSDIAYRKAYMLFKEFIQEFAKHEADKLKENILTESFDFLQLKFKEYGKERMNTGKVVGDMFTVLLNNPKRCKSIGIDFNDLEKSCAYWWIKNYAYKNNIHKADQLRDELITSVPIWNIIKAIIWVAREKRNRRKAGVLRAEIKELNKQLLTQLLFASVEQRDLAKTVTPISLASKELAFGL